MLKKFIAVLAAGILLLSCGGNGSEKKEATGELQKLVLGVSPVPHQELAELVKDDLKAEGIDLEIVVFNDYVQPNLQLKDKSIDSKFFLHVP